MNTKLFGKICKALAFSISIGTILICNSVSVHAAPKEMADGTVFDAEYYASRYADVVAVYGTKESSLFQHYTDYGRAENREAVKTPDTSTFDPVYYAQQNPDVVAVYGTGNNNLYQHYLQYGMKEGRTPTENAPATTPTSTPASNQQNTTLEMEESEQSEQANSISDEEAKQIFLDFIDNIYSRVSESACAFFDADSDMTINQSEWSNLVAWAIDNYNTVNKEQITEDEMIAIGHMMHNGTFKLPDSLYYVYAD